MTGPAVTAHHPTDPTGSHRCSWCGTGGDPELGPLKAYGPDDRMHPASADRAAGWTATYHANDTQENDR